MRPTHRRVAAVISSLLFAGSAAAQDPRSTELTRAVRPGDDVAIVQYDLTRTVGVVESIDPSTLVLRLANGDARSLGVSSVGRVTRRDSVASGAKIGAAIGGAWGLVGGLLLSSLCESDSDCTAGLIATFTAFGVGGGAGLGAALDSTWQRTVFLRDEIDGARVRLPGEWRPELVVSLGRNASSVLGGASTDLGVAWVHVPRSGFGYEVAVHSSLARSFRHVDCVRLQFPLGLDHPCLGSGEEGEVAKIGASATLLYFLPVPRVQPYFGGGLVFGQQERRFTYISTRDGTPQVHQDSTDGGFTALVASVGARIPIRERIYIRPDVTFDLGNYARNVRASVGMTYGW